MHFQKQEEPVLTNFHWGSLGFAHLSEWSLRFDSEHSNTDTAFAENSRNPHWFERKRLTEKYSLLVSLGFLPCALRFQIRIPKQGAGVAFSHSNGERLNHAQPTPLQTILSLMPKQQVEVLSELYLRSCAILNGSKLQTPSSATLAKTFARYKGHLGPLGPKLEKDSENEFPGPLGLGPKKAKTESKKSQNRLFFNYAHSFSTPFSTFWALGPRGPGNSFSDSFSNFGTKGPNPVADPRNPNTTGYGMAMVPQPITQEPPKIAIVSPIVAEWATKALLCVAPRL